MPLWQCPAMRYLPAACFLLCATPALAFNPAREAQVAQVMEKLKAEPLALRAFLGEMPKGGDLHNRLDGSVWAEDILSWADADGDCIDTVTHAITLGPCGKGQAAADGPAGRDPAFYSATIDALSMRDFVPGSESGRAHAFAAFGRFAPVMAGHLAEALTAARAQAARDHVQYVEQVADPAEAVSPALFGAAFDAKNFAADLGAVAPRLPALAAAARHAFDVAEARRDIAQNCIGDVPTPPCAVRTRYVFFVQRTRPPADVFAQMALGYALADTDPRFAGITLAGPEDDPMALRDYDLHMRMLRFFGAKYPRVKLALPAGEIALGMVPPSALGHHIRDAVEVAGAARIGHGYALPYEADTAGLLKEMADKGIAVEISLTGDAVTSGLAGNRHPMRLYMKAGVPVVLTADDGGVLRIDLAHDYVRAVLEQKLTYPELKRVATDGLEYSFLSGESLWDKNRHLVAVCAHDDAGCRKFLAANPKAAAEWTLDQAFAVFEARALAHGFPE